jgi:transposase
MWKPAERLRITKSQRAQVEGWMTSPTTQQRVVHRSRIVLLAASGTANHAIAEEVGVSRPTVLLWRRRFEQEGPEGLLRDRPRGSGKPPLPEKKIQAVIEATLHAKPKGATHWNVRSMAKAQGISPAAVQRIWAAHGLKPHLVRTFKLSRDPRFLEKLRDVVGLYLNPPEHALVLCFDEKSQIQALDRTQPGLPLKKGRAGTQTHDYKRNGTTSLFVALNLLDGTVIGECMSRHRHQEFLRFLKRLDRETPRRLPLHLILDNYQTHKHPQVQRWLERHPRFHFHFIPTSSSWLNLVERWLRELTDKAIRRGAFPSVPALVAAIYDYIEHSNRDPKPLVWTATADQIVAKVSRGKAKLETLH